MSARYLTCAETAKLVRKALKDTFRGVKFYVRSKTYAGGASIDVSWVDGPTTKEVDAVLDLFDSKSFDGSIDLACHWDHWLLPDGSVQLAKGPGTEGSLGYISSVDNPKPHPDAELVRFGAGYNGTSRATSRALLERVAREVSEETGWPVPEIVDSTSYLNRTKKVPSAYYKRDWTVKVPGSDQELETYYNRRLWATSDYDRPEPEPEPDTADDLPPPTDGDDYSIEYDRDWTWIRFPAKPEEAVRTALKALGARFSRRRTAWYIRERVDLLTLAATLG